VHDERLLVRWPLSGPAGPGMGCVMSETNKKTIRVVREEALRKGMLDKLDGLYTDDYVYHGVPMLGDLRGSAAFKELARGFIDAVSEFQEIVQDQVAEGDKVVTRLSGRGKHTGPFMGAAPTGKPLTWSAISIARFVDGRIAEEWVEFDMPQPSAAARCRS
jgi:predicted ester cyclase